MTGGPSAPGSGSPAVPMVVERSGGFAGFHDVVEIAADGSAQVTSRDAPTRPCTPDPAGVAALRAMDLAAVVAAPAGPPVADGFGYAVRIGGASASAGEGSTGVRARFVAAAAAVIASCLVPPGA